MAVALKVTIDATEVTRTLRRLNLATGPGLAAMNRALDKAAFLVQADAAENQIIRGGRQAPHPTRLTSRTGTLRRSIRVNRTTDLVRSVGTDLVYGAVHEFGGRFHPPRPYLAPALAAKEPEFQGIFAEELQRLIDAP